MEAKATLLGAVIEGRIGTITLNNAAKHNCLSEAMIDDLCSSLEQMTAHEVRAVIVRAQAGSKVFSAGNDVRELPTHGRDPLTCNDPLRRAVRAVELFPAPAIAMVEGSVWGGACELVMSCDLIVAADDCTFAMTVGKMGVPYNISGVQNLMNTCGMPLCKEMLFTARAMPVQRLVDQGIVSHAVPRARLEAVTFNIAEQIVKNSPLVIAITNGGVTAALRLAQSRSGDL
ncbi:MAG TPA: methylmalonyl-CoA decarboxylase [Terracidiphilus sp.]|jgi:methylmalonyl-CoA decarboxylase